MSVLSMIQDVSDLGSRSGTYALVIELASAPVDLAVGRLGLLRFEAPFYLYVGSALGPGGLAARLRHHLGCLARPHWHIDYLRTAARLRGIWITRDERRMECGWADAATRIRGASRVPGFGASDCRCASHLVALPRAPRRASFRRLLTYGLGYSNFQLLSLAV